MISSLAYLAEEAELEEKEFPPEPVQEELKPLPDTLVGDFDNWPNPPDDNDDDDDEFFFDGTPRWREE